MDQDKKLQIFNKLKTQGNFVLMSETLLGRLIDELEIVRFSKGEIILTEGKKIDSLYIILNGVVSIHLHFKILYRLTEVGDTFGEISFVNDDVCGATVRADTNLNLWSISRKTLQKLGKGEVFEWLCKILAKKVMKTSEVKVR